MKFSITAAFLLAASPFVAARNCKTGLNYCTQTLLNIGAYQSQLDQASFDHDHSWIQYDYAPQNGMGLLWTCRGGRNGVIEYVKNCPGGCKDNGDGNSDQCINSVMDQTYVDEYYENPIIEKHHWTSKMRIQREH